MKKRTKLTIGIVLAVILSGAVFGIAEKNNFLNIKELGNEDYYVQITKDGEKTGDNVFPYYYKETAYNADGNKIDVEFYANKNLNINSNICVSTQSQSSKKINTVESYEEVKSSELPEKVEKIFNASK